MPLPLAPVALLLRSLPDRAHAHLFSAALNHVMKGQSLAVGMGELLAAVEQEDLFHRGSPENVAAG